MQDEFNPPIETRRTEDLIKIAAEHKKWQPRAVKLALEELSKRNIDPKRIEEVKKSCEANENFFSKQIKAEQKFNFFSLNPRYLFIDWSEIFMFLFSWEYEKDGYLHKAKVQRKYRFIAIVLLILSILFFNLYLI